MSISSNDSFLIENEMLISFYVQKLKDEVSEFNSAFFNLKELSNAENNKDVVWDSIERAANAVWRITQIIWPGKRIKASKEQQNLTIARGQELQRLFALTLGDRKNVNDFRNRLTHFDEDFDDWYLDSIQDDNIEERRIVWRGIGYSCHPLHTRHNCIVQEYDVDWGILSAFGKRYDLRAYKRLVETIEERVVKVDEYIDKTVPNRMRIKIV